MVDWIIAGALTAVLLAEVADAWALRQLALRCIGIQPRTRDEQRLVRWYAEGFDHSIALTSWLGCGCIALTGVAALCGAQPVVIAAGALLSAGALGERRFSAILRRRFLQVSEGPLGPGLRPGYVHAGIVRSRVAARDAS